MRTLATMESLGADRTRIRVAIGPCIAQTSYQVGPEFRDRFVTAAAANANYFINDIDGRFRFDLVGFVSGQLISAGIDEPAWVGLDSCAQETQLFSYRRSTLMGETDFGRGLSAIALEKRF